MRTLSRSLPVAAAATLLAAVTLLAAATGCRQGSDEPAFPDDFLFGVATAGFQNDPGCPTLPASECIDAGSDWYQFVTSPEVRASRRSYLSGDPLSLGPGSYELYEKDFDLVKDGLSGNAVRLSLEWSRIFPRATFGVEGFAALRAQADGKALAHYHAVLRALKQRGLTPLVTLHHYTLPAWLHDAVGCHKDLTTCQPRGWLDERAVHEITKYAGFAAQEFAAEVDLWATLNEPFAVILPGFIAPTADRTNPPAALLALTEARTALLAMIKAHARMYDAVKAADQSDADGDGRPSQVGLVYNMTPAAPRDPQNPLDVLGAERLFYLYNEVFLNAVLRGELDENLDGNRVARPELQRMDYVGINYYTRAIVDGTAKPFLPDLSPLSTFNPLTSTLYTEYPKGIYDMVAYVNERGYPAIITENGSADPSDLMTAPRYLAEHLGWLQRAVATGARVRGYFYWTLVDNYEWNHGLQLSYGLYQLLQDPQKTRVPRLAVEVFRQIATRKAIPPELQLKYPLPD
jgi:beta-galactosidase